MTRRLATDLGDLLWFFGLANAAEVAAARLCQRRRGGLLSGHFVRLGALDEDAMIAFLAEVYRVPAIRLAEYSLDPAIVGLIPESVAWARQVIAVHRESSVLIVAMADPTDSATILDVRRRSGAREIEVVLVGEEDLARALRGSYPGSAR